MAEYEFVCHECGRTFGGLTSHIGEAMCPACGSIDIELVVPAPSGQPATLDDRHDAPEAHDSDTSTTI